MASGTRARRSSSIYRREEGEAAKTKQPSKPTKQQQHRGNQEEHRLLQEYIEKLGGTLPEGWKVEVVPNHNSRQKMVEKKFIPPGSGKPLRSRAAVARELGLDTRKKQGGGKRKQPAEETHEGRHEGGEAPETTPSPRKSARLSRKSMEEEQMRPQKQTTGSPQTQKAPPRGGSNTEHLAETKGRQGDETKPKGNLVVRTAKRVFANLLGKGKGERKRVHFTPPASPYGLVQEQLHEDPWRVLVACMLLNKTASGKAKETIFSFIQAFPDAHTAAHASVDRLESRIAELGLQRKRAQDIKTMSQQYLDASWSDPSELHGIGQYAKDAFHLFCSGKWREVEPHDKELKKYKAFLESTGGHGKGYERDPAPVPSPRP